MNVLLRQATLPPTNAPSSAHRRLSSFIFHSFPGIPLPLLPRLPSFASSMPPENASSDKAFAFPQSPRGVLRIKIGRTACVLGEGVDREAGDGFYMDAS